MLYKAGSSCTKSLRNLRDRKNRQRSDIIQTQLLKLYKNIITSDIASDINSDINARKNNKEV